MANKRKEATTKGDHHQRQVNSTPTSSHCQLILDYLQTHEQGITPYEALEKFGCLRLSGRIHDLRAKGWDIETEIIHRNGKQFACYKMGGKNEAV